MESEGLPNFSKKFFVGKTKVRNGRSHLGFHRFVSKFCTKSKGKRRSFRIPNFTRCLVSGRMSKTPYIILGAVALVFVGIAVYFFFFFKPPKSCNFGCAAAPSFMNGPQCLSVVETYHDDTIPAPSTSLQPYLSSFDFVEGEGAPFCSPVWYSFRYVRNSDGGYSNLGVWSEAIYSGSPNQPWPPGVPQGTPSATCGANQPTIVLLGPINSPAGSTSPDTLSGYSLNVHRQIGSIDSTGASIGFDPLGEGDIVGVFQVYPGQNGATATFIDAVFNPSPNSSATSCC